MGNRTAADKMSENTVRCTAEAVQRRVKAIPTGSPPLSTRKRLMSNIFNEKKVCTLQNGRLFTAAFSDNIFFHSHLFTLASAAMVCFCLAPQVSLSPKLDSSRRRCDSRRRDGVSTLRAGAAGPALAPRRCAGICQRRCDSTAPASAECAPRVQAQRHSAHRKVDAGGCPLCCKCAI